LQLDDGFGALEAPRQASIIALNKGQLGCHWIGFEGLRAAFRWNQCTEGSGVPQPAPLGEGRGVEPLATQDGGDASGFSGAIGLGQDAQLVLRGERPAARPIRQFG
jgi:hypothetical protein